MSITIPLRDSAPPRLSAPELARYARQLVLPRWGLETQKRLKQARVLVVGAGGLGCPVIQILSAAGVGTLGVVDHDRVAASNLHRQMLYRVSDIGKRKAEASIEAVAQINPFVRAVAHPVRLDRTNVRLIVAGYDVIVDGSDNFETRYLLSECADDLQIPVVWGAVNQHTGQLSTFWSAASISYRDVFPTQPAEGMIQSCEIGGVLGSVTMLLGSALAQETLNLISGRGRSLIGRLLVVDASDGTTRELALAAELPPTGAAPSEPLSEQLISAEEVISADQLIAALRAEPDDGPYMLLDVRTDREWQTQTLSGSVNIPLQQLLSDGVGGSRLDAPLVVFCASGVRSQLAAAALTEQGFSRVMMLTGGLDAWPVEHKSWLAPGHTLRSA